MVYKSLLLSLFLFSNLHAQFSIDALVRFVHSFPQPDSINLPLSNPQALSIDVEGNVFVLDTGNNRIVKFDSAGTMVASVGGFGWEKEQFDQPLDVTAESTLDVFIADFNNERIERYDKDLNFISSFSSNENTAPNLQFAFPVGIDVSRHGEIFVSDSETNRVLKLNSFGNPVLSFGDFNSGEGQLQAVGKLDVTANDRVYVVDGGSRDVVVFDYYGNLLVRFGKHDLLEPQGLFQSEEYLYVADSGKNRVAVFDKDFRLAFAWGAQGDQFGAFESPNDVAGFDNRVFVLDSGNNRVQVFTIAINPR